MEPIAGSSSRHRNESNRLRRWSLLLAGVSLTTCALAVIVGCGSATAEVTGTITIDGEPPDFDGIEIVFLAGDGRLVTAPVHPDGTYSMAGMPVGKAKIGLIYIAPEIARRGAAKGSRLPTPDRDGSTGHERSGKTIANPIPENLREPSKSGLWMQVEPHKTNVFDYDVER
jgi:hypothetical protein